MKKWMRMMVAAAMVQGVHAAERALDYAAEDAAVEILKSFQKSGVVSGRIAMLPLRGDAEGLFPVVRNELSRYPALYDFYVRDDADWNALVSEIEFGDRKDDAMNVLTIQKFGSISGVDSLLYGTVREAVVENGEGLVRLTLTLADVETGRQIWTGNVSGQYRRLLFPKGDRLAATVDAAKTAAAEFAVASANFGKLDVYFMPLLSDGVDYTDFVRSEFVKQAAGDVRVFADLSEQKGQRMAMSLARDYGKGDVSVPELAQLMKQLDRMGDLAAGEGASAKPAGAVVPKALLLARFGRMAEDADFQTTNVSLNMQLVKLDGGQQVWGANVDGSAVNVKGFMPLVRRYWKWVAGGVLGLLVLGKLLGAMRRSR